MTRGNIQLQDCQILAHEQLAGNQYTLTLSSTEIANATKAGQFVHLRVSDALLMRRPISIMLADVDNATFTLLYKIVGEGTRQLAQRKIGEVLSVIGPIGNGFKRTGKKMPVLIGGGVGMPPIICMAQQMQDDLDYNPFVVLGSEVPFPFTPTPNSFADTAGATHTMPLLDDWNIACRLASLQDFEGVYQGYVTDLARIYLDDLSVWERTQVEIYACGPEPMLAAAAKLAKAYNLPCQVSLEEYMACAVGGCAGCVVKTNDLKMQRVCVDGPVFNAADVF